MSVRSALRKGKRIAVIAVAVGLCLCGGSGFRAKEASGQGVRSKPVILPQSAPVAQAAVKTPVKTYGALQIADYDHDQKKKTAPRRQLCDQKGNPVQLRGMSTFGLQWQDGDWILTEEAFRALAEDWKCDVVRLAMYVGEGGYAERPQELLQKVETGIRLACKYGMYVIVDWHVLSPGDPTDPVYLKAGVKLPQYAKIRKKHPKYTGPQLFFAYLSQKYGDCENVLWEICNEPNGLGGEANQKEVWKKKLRPYCQSVVNAIRAYDKDDRPNIIICGTDQWSQLVEAPAASPIKDDSNQIMYAMHFYAGTHDTGDGASEDQAFRSRVKRALNQGLAIFCTEWGTSEASGNGGPYVNYAKRWLKFMEQQKISWCNWSLSRKRETSAAFLPNAPAEGLKDTNGDGVPNWKVKTEVSASGRFIRSVLRKKKGVG